MDLVRHSTSRFTFEPADDFGPVWSPDDRQIAFQSDRSGVHQLYLKNADGTGGDQLLLNSNIFDIAEDWSSDGRFILFSRLDPIKRFDLWILPLFGDRTPFLFVTTPFGECCGQFSPDGRWIAYSSNESGRGQIYIRPFPGPGQAMQISIDGGSAPRWRRDGKELFYVAPDGKLMAVKVQASTSLDASVPAALFDAEMAEAPDAQYAVNTDGQRFLVVKNLEGKKPGSITIVLNWNQKTPS